MYLKKFKSYINENYNINEGKNDRSKTFFTEIKNKIVPANNKKTFEKTLKEIEKAGLTSEKGIDLISKASDFVSFQLQTLGVTDKELKSQGFDIDENNADLEDVIESYIKGDHNNSIMNDFNKIIIKTLGKDVKDVEKMDQEINKRLN